MSKKEQLKKRTSYETALGLLHACVATEVRCVAEVVRNVRAGSKASHRLLEEILALEEQHAERLVRVLQVHQAGA